MSAKDYKLCVSGLGGIPFISKVSKTNANLMLSDRRQVPVEEMYAAIKAFAQGQIKEGFSSLEVTLGGKVDFTIKLPNDKVDKRNADMRKRAIAALELTKGFTPEQRAEFSNALKTVEEFSNYILELTD